MTKKHRVSKEVKEQILKRIKEEGISVAQTATDHGLSEAAIYRWLSGGVKGQLSTLEIAKLRRENRELLELVGEVTLKLSNSQKKS